ncbi:MAG TPA: hypothetical protein VHA52_05690 [Candidatus Babeliaceae bacterium]|nr:hypothetical protein [Candidatus Babeliaceae bacterium]
MENQHISFWGRSFDEYSSMFNLKNMGTSTKVLSVADGPSTFNLEARERGISVRSVDPRYGLHVEDLRTTFAESYQFNKDLFYRNKKQFVFESDVQREETLMSRRGTFERFLRDFSKYSGEFYKPGALPFLNFGPSEFDMVLCSNLLFIFDHVLDLDFHLAAVDEMLRVGGEVRIFPIYDIAGKLSTNLFPVLQHLTAMEYLWSVEFNSYHVFRNGNRLLRIVRPT